MSIKNFMWEEKVANKRFNFPLKNYKKNLDDNICWQNFVLYRNTRRKKKLSLDIFLKPIIYSTLSIYSMRIKDFFKFIFSFKKKIEKIIVKLIHNEHLGWEIYLNPNIWPFYFDEFLANVRVKFIGSINFLEDVWWSLEYFFLVFCC